MQVHRKFLPLAFLGIGLLASGSLSATETHEEDAVRSVAVDLAFGWPASTTAPAAKALEASLVPEPSGPETPSEPRRFPVSIPGTATINLEPGTWRLEIDSPNVFSSASLVVEPGDRAGGPLLLRIEESQPLDGQIIAPSGAPVPGARVFAEVERALGESLAPFLPDATSGADGVFRLELPAAAERVLLTVLAPGFALLQSRHDLRSDQPLLFPLDTGAGSLLVTYEGALEDSMPALTRRIFLVHDHPMQPGLLHLWTQLHGTQQPTDQSAWRLGAMPPGLYRACLRTPAIQPYLSSVAPLPASLLDEACSSSGYLTVGDELLLAIPAEAREIDQLEE